MLVMLIDVLFGRRLEIIPRGFPYSSHPRPLMAMVLVAVVLMAITMVVMLLMLVMALIVPMVLSDAGSADRTGKREPIE